MKSFFKLYCLSLSLLLHFSTAALFAQTRPDALQAYRNGRNLEAANRLQEAVANYNESVRICQDEINRTIATRDTYTVLTWSLQRLKRYRDVISWGEKGLILYPDDYRLNEVLGEAYFYMDDYVKSLSSMQRFVNALPRNDRASTAYFFIGEIFRIQGKFLLADMAYTTAVRLEPNVALWWYRLGVSREAVREYASAQEAYERAARLNPNYSEAVEGVARMKRQLRQG
jgi:tetratricopeptide (TPR) repeat protein